jgi:hypothetical protein
MVEGGDGSGGLRDSDIKLVRPRSLRLVSFFLCLNRLRRGSRFGTLVCWRFEGLMGVAGWKAYCR